MDFQPRWRCTYIHCASSHNQKKDNNKFKNNKQLDLTENQTIWKSNNQGVKEETFTQTGGRGGDGQLGREDSWQGSGWRTRGSHICMWIPRRNKWGVRQTMKPRVPVWGNKASKPLLKKTCGSSGSRKNSQPHRKVHWRDPQGSRTYTKPPTCESAPEGPNLIVGSGGSDWKAAESWASSVVLSLTPPPHTVSQHSDVSCPTLVNT